MKNQVDMIDPSNAADQWQRIAGTTQVLVRSRVEIATFLSEFVAGPTPLSAFFTGGPGLFVTQLLHVDPNQEFILVDYSPNRVANGVLLSAPTVMFSGSHARGSIEFVATHPSEAIFKDACAVRFDFPDMLMLHQRRTRRRIRVVPDVPLRCIADAGGVISFECKIIDVSRGGLGTMVYDDAIVLGPGTVLKGCRIIHPRGTVTEVDIEIRYSNKLTLPDGTIARRSGCSFIGDPAKIEDLIKVFVLNMESPEADF